MGVEPSEVLTRKPASISRVLQRGSGRGRGDSKAAVRG